MLFGGDLLEIKKLEENIRPTDWEMVRIKEMGNVVELMYQEKRNSENVIKNTNQIMKKDICF